VLSYLGLQGVVSPARLQAAGQTGSALVYVAQVLGGSGGAKVMAFALALSVIAAVGTAIVLTARIIYGMASYRTLPEFLANVSRRFNTPVAASVVVGVLITALTWVYLLATSIQSAFSDVVNVSGQLFGAFYILTALAAVVYYRRRVFTSVWDALTLGVLPLAAAGFLAWILVQYLQTTYQTAATRPQVWSLVGVVVAGLVLMIVARFVLRSPFFQIQRESDTQKH